MHKETLTSCFPPSFPSSIPPFSSLPLSPFYCPLYLGCWMPIRFTAFVPMLSRTCRISRCYRSTTTRSKPSPRAPSLRCELYRPCESNACAHINVPLYMLWHILSRHHKTWANTGVVYSHGCVIIQEWAHEGERRVNPSSSQTHGHTQLVWALWDQKWHTHTTPTPPTTVTQTSPILSKWIFSFFFFSNKQGRPHAVINTDPTLCCLRHMQITWHTKHLLKMMDSVAHWLTTHTHKHMEGTGFKGLSLKQASCFAYILKKG